MTMTDETDYTHCPHHAGMCCGLHSVVVRDGKTVDLYLKGVPDSRGAVHLSQAVLPDVTHIRCFNRGAYEDQYFCKDGDWYLQCRDGTTGLAVSALRL